MKKLALLLTAALLASYCSQQVQAQGFDSVRSNGGKTSTAGKVSAITRDEVTVSQGAGGVKKSVPVNEIHMVVFTGEPAELSRARINAYNGAYENALAELEKVDAAEVTRPEVQTDIDFFKAYCTGKLALGGAGSLPAAETAVKGFVAKNSNSFHFYECCELLGDLAVAQGNYADAARYYGPLEASSFADFKMRAAVRLGRAAQAQGDHSAAVSKFDTVLAMPATTPETEKEALTATLGKAVSLAATDKVDPAIQLVTQVIKDASPEEIDLNARANNALGNCYMKAGKNKEALRAFLKVDLIYNGSPEAHAEALAQLSKLWTSIGKEDRAQEARATLKDRYPGSAWAQKLGG